MSEKFDLSAALKRILPSFWQKPTTDVRKGVVVMSADVNLDPPSPAKKRRGQFGKAVPINFPNHYEDEVKAHKEGFRPFQLLNPDMLTESRNTADWPITTDPQTGLQCRARISEIRWLERAKVKVGSKVKESTRKRTFKPTRFREAFRRPEAMFGVRGDKLTESHRKSFRKLQEGGFMDFEGGYSPAPTGWPGIANLPYGAFVPYPPGPLTRQLYLQDMWEQMSRAFQMYNHYDVMHGAIETISAFVIGDGVRIQAEDDDAQVVWDEFEERVEFQPGLPDECMMGSVNGENLWHVPEIAVGGKPGYVDFVSKDPGTCWEIITAPDDVRNVVGYYFNYPTRYMIETVDDLPTTEYIVELLPPEEMIHIKFNVQKNEARGRSDIFSSLSDAKMLQDVMRYRTIKVMNSAGIVLVHKITGDQGDIDNIRNAKVGAGWLGAGTEIFTNESETIDILKGADSENAKSGLHGEMLTQIGNGIGLSADYMGVDSSGGRAGALTRTTPAAKLFRKRQKKYDPNIVKVFKRVIQIAKKHGRLGANVSEECEVTFPEIAPENTKEKLGNIILAEQMEYIDHEMATNMVQKELDITNPPEYDDLQAKIQAYKTNKAKTDPTLAAMFQPQPGLATTAVPPEGPNPAPAAPPTGQMPGGKGNGQNPNKQGKNQSKKALNGDQQGLSNDSRRDIKKSLQSKRDKILGEAKSGDHIKGEKKAHKAMKRGLRSRTKDTLNTMSEEAISASSSGAMLRGTGKDADVKAMLAENSRMNKTKFKGLLSEADAEVAPPGWDKTIAQMPDEIHNPYALAWWMHGQGYQPKGAAK